MVFFCLSLYENEQTENRFKRALIFSNLEWFGILFLFIIELIKNNKSNCVLLSIISVNYEKC